MPKVDWMCLLHEDEDTVTYPNGRFISKPGAARIRICHHCVKRVKCLGDPEPICLRAYFVWAWWEKQLVPWWDHITDPVTVYCK